jgi:hypothetical protein
MQKNSDLYDFTQNLQSAIFRAAFKAFLISLEEEDADRPTIPAILQLRSGYAESPAWIMVQIAEFLPEPLTVAKFCKRAVYSAPRLIQGLLELLASEKYLDRIGEDYYLTDAGQDVIDTMTLRRTAILSGFVSIPPADIGKLESLLRRVIEASLQTKTPPGTWCLTHSRNRASSNALPLVNIIRYCTDLNAFRDDCHLAAYHAHGIHGRTWEAFNFVRERKATTADELFNLLAYRGFTQAEWAESLQDLVDRGWVEKTGIDYKSTDTGETIYQKGQEQTDAYFYAPWSTLSGDEFDELIALMQQLHDQVNQSS